MEVNVIKELVFLEPNKIDSVPFTTSKVIAEMTGINHRRVKDAIRKHETEMLDFGLLGAYETESTGGRPKEIIRLNEQQSTFLMTLLKNTPVVVAFKKELVRQFYAMRAELLQRQMQRTEQKPVRWELTAGEIGAVTKRQSQIAVLLEMGMDYQEIKSIVLERAALAKVSQGTL